MQDNRNFCTIFFGFYIAKCLLGININNVGTVFYPLFLMIIEFNIFLHTYFFINAILFSDKYISFRYSYKEKIGILFIIINEYDRIFFVFIVSFFILKIIRWLLDTQSGLNKAEQFLHAKKFVKEIKTLKTIFKCKSIFSNIVIFLLHLFYAYFILIFGNINSYTQIALFFSTIISLITYCIIWGFICLISSFLRVLSIKKKIEILFIISNFLNNLI